MALYPILTPEETQAALIALLKAQPELVSAVQEEIREDNWQGTEFRYPAYRLAVGTCGPLTNGECRHLFQELNWSVLAYAEDSSSRQAAYLVGLVAGALIGKQLRTSRIIPVTRIRIPDGGLLPVVPEGERFWRGEVMFTCQVKAAGGLN